MFLMKKIGIVYTFVVNIYARRLTFCTKIPRVLHQNRLRFAPK